MLWRTHTILIAFGYFQASIYGADKVADWNSSTGNWSDASKWTITPGPVDPGTVPSNGNGGFTYDANINSGATTLDLNVGVGKLYLAKPFLSAQLSISGGHTLTTSAGGTLGHHSGETGSSGNGTVNVTGAGSSWTNSAGNITVGDYGIGNLSINNGGVVITTGLQAGDGTTSPFVPIRGSGHVSVTGQGSSLSVSGLLNVGFNQGFGDLTIDSVASVTTSELKVGNSRGSMRFNLGRTPGALAPLNSNGPATISNSTLYASFAAPPSIGVYPLLHYQQLIGQFGPANVDGLGQMGYLIDYGAGINDTIEIKIFLPGDHNSDGSVDAADYIAWRKTDGTQTGYNAWRANFGKSIGASSNSRSQSVGIVPEPRAAFLVGFLALLVITRNHRTVG